MDGRKGFGPSSYENHTFSFVLRKLFSKNVVRQGRRVPIGTPFRLEDLIEIIENA